jgi:hypothetical protein
MSSKKLSIMIALLLLSGTMALVFFKAISASADTHPKAVVQSEANEPKLDPKTLVTDNSTLSENPASQVQASQLAAELVSQWKASKLSAGWVHLVYKVSTEVENGVVLPDGSSRPFTYLEDGWYFLNDKGMVEKNVVTLKDDMGAVLQLTAFDGNTGYNLTYGDKREGMEAYELKLDLGFSQHVAEAEALGVIIQYRDTRDDNKPAREFSFEETYETPTQIGNSKDLVSGTSVLGLFNSETGEMIMTRKVWTYVTGVEVLFEECELLLMEVLPDAPTEIVDVLESVK